MWNETDLSNKENIIATELIHIWLSKNKPSSGDGGIFPLSTLKSRWTSYVLVIHFYNNFYFD